MFKNYQNYEVYDDGRIWSYKSNKFLKPSTNNKGYKQVWLLNDEGKRKMYKVHKVVYEAVTSEEIPEGFEVNHLDENKANNHIDNLNLVTHKENCNFGTRNKRIAKTMTNGKLSKAVGAFQNGELVMTFPSIAEAQRNGFNSVCISACCRGKLKTHKGYEWRYI